MMLVPGKRRKTFEANRVDRVTQVHGRAPGKVNALPPGDVQVGVTESVGRDARAIGIEVEGKAIL
jgi:hypothetical protein